MKNESSVYFPHPNIEKKSSNYSRNQMTFRSNSQMPNESKREERMRKTIATNESIFWLVIKREKKTKN